jgi:hypothetical protein
MEGWTGNKSADTYVTERLKMEFEEWARNHNPTMESLTNEWMYGRDGYQTGKKLM